MNADAFRQLYEYHFAANRKVWNTWVMSLTQEQFVQPIEYSVGSVRNHIVHLINVDKGWFSELRHADVDDSDFMKPTEISDREKIRAEWDQVEQEMRDYLATLNDDMLFTKPFTESPDNVMILWQVLIHVANHGTDHRAQLLRILHDMGMKTDAQDYFFHIVGEL